jgi:hypothetical protein
MTLGLQPKVEAILPLIREALGDHLAKTQQEKLEALETIQICERPFSTVVFLRARTSKDTHQLVMKTTVHHPFNKAATERENQALVEYNILRYLYPKFKEIEKCSVPRPILVFPELETYLMEFVNGHLLVDDLRWARYFSPRKRFRKLWEHLYQCGRWLYHFQQFTGFCEGEREALMPVFERAEQRLKLIEELGDPCCPKNLRGFALRLMYDWFEQLEGMPIPVSGRHSDFILWNIISGQDGITVLDFLGYEEDCVAVDLLKMLVDLENEKLCVSASPKRLKALQESFLLGFGKIPSIPRQALLICEAMQRVVSIWGSLTVSDKNIRHRLEKNVRIKRHIRWLADEHRASLI